MIKNYKELKHRIKNFDIQKVSLKTLGGFLLILSVAALTPLTMALLPTQLTENVAFLNQEQTTDLDTVQVATDLENVQAQSESFTNPKECIEAEKRGTLLEPRCEEWSCGPDGNTARLYSAPYTQYKLLKESRECLECQTAIGGVSCTLATTNTPSDNLPYGGCGVLNDSTACGKFADTCRWDGQNCLGKTGCGQFSSSTNCNGWPGCSWNGASCMDEPKSIGETVNYDPNNETIVDGTQHNNGAPAPKNGSLMSPGEFGFPGGNSSQPQQPAYEWKCASNGKTIIDSSINQGTGSFCLGDTVCRTNGNGAGCYEKSTPPPPPPVNQPINQPVNQPPNGNQGGNTGGSQPNNPAVNDPIDPPTYEPPPPVYACQGGIEPVACAGQMWCLDCGANQAVCKSGTYMGCQAAGSGGSTNPPPSNNGGSTGGSTGGGTTNPPSNTTQPPTTGGGSCPQLCASGGPCSMECGSACFGISGPCTGTAVRECRNGVPTCVGGDYIDQ